MKHLTVDEIIGFVSFDKINEETLALASKVNNHIGVCEECLRKVRTFQLVNDSLESLKRDAGFRKELEQQAAELEKELLKQAPEKSATNEGKKRT